MNVHTLLPHVECTIMTVVITFLFIIYIAIIITRQNVNYPRISCANIFYHIIVCNIYNVIIIIVFTSKYAQHGT